MANLSSLVNGLLAVTKPTGMWQSIIFAFNSGISNYVWAIVVFTIVLKLVLLPLDFFNKRMSAKNTKMQAIIQPEVQKLQKKYGNDKQKLNQETMKLYKEKGYNIYSSCVVMLIYMGLTMAIFFTLFAALGNIANYKIVENYENLKSVYVEQYDESYAASEKLTEEEKVADATQIAKQKTLEAYNTKYNQRWLWVENMWLPDTPWTKAIPEFSEYKSLAKLSFQDDKNEAEEVILTAADKEAAAKAEYDAVMESIRPNVKSNNGYMIIMILAAGTTILSQLAMQGKLKFKRKKKGDEPAPAAAPQMGGWIGIVVISGLMIYISLTSNAVFGVYIFVSSLFGVATQPLVNLLSKKLDKIAEAKKAKKEEKPSYKR